MSANKEVSKDQTLDNQSRSNIRFCSSKSSLDANNRPLPSFTFSHTLPNDEESRDSKKEEKILLKKKRDRVKEEEVVKKSKRAKLKKRKLTQSDSENNYITHNLSFKLDSPIQEFDENEEKLQDIHPEHIMQTTMTTTTTSLIELSPIQTTTSEVLTEDQLLDGVDDIEDNTEGEHDDIGDKTITHNHLHHYSNRCRLTSISLERKKHDKITAAQLDRLSSLIKIIRDGSYNEFSEALEGKSFKNLLNVFVDGQTVLHYSLIYGRSLAWCKKLVHSGANPNLSNRAGWHPIHLAAFNGSRETMRYLIDCIAN